MTNYHWEFSIERTRRQLQLDTAGGGQRLHRVAMSLPRLRAQDLRQVGGGQAVRKSVIGLIGAGTGWACRG